MRRAEAGGLLAATILAAPVLVGVGYSLLGALGLRGAGAAGFTLAPLARVLTDAAVWRGAAWSLWVAAAATMLAAGVAVVVAATLRGTRPAARLGRALAVLPLPVPHVVAAALGVLVLSQSGLLARLAYAAGWVDAPAGMPPLVYDPAGVGVIAALAWKEVPFLSLIAFSLLSTRVAVLEEAARSLGAGPWATFRRVTLPVLGRGLLPAVVAVFVFAVGSYEVVALLAPSDPLALPLLTLERYTDSDLARRAEAFVLVLLTLTLSAVAVAAHEWVRASWEGLEG